MSKRFKDLRINSIDISEGKNRTPPNRAMLRAVGFKDEDFKKPMIGIASTWSEVTPPCNMHIDKLAVAAKQGGARDGGGAPLIFNTITVADGIAWATKECDSLYLVEKSLRIPLRPSWALSDLTALWLLADVTRTCQAV